MMDNQKRKEMLLRVYFEKYDTFVLHRKEAAKIVNESETTLDRWKDNAIGPAWSKDERSKNGRVTYLIVDIVDFLVSKEINHTIS
ncbi:MAG TPA: hypothetical protein ENK66_10260 [Arcobacter sp.]|nr:hypothetical protein [Arcobacter sp.]